MWTIQEKHAIGALIAMILILPLNPLPHTAMFWHAKDA